MQDQQKYIFFCGNRSIAVELEMPWLLGLIISTCLNSEPSSPLIHHLRTLVSCGAGRFFLYSNIDISFACNASPYLRHIYCFKLICFSTSNCLNDSFEGQLLTKNYLASILDKGSRPVRKVQFLLTLFKRGGGGHSHVQKLCCKFGVFWRSFNNMKFAWKGTFEALMVKFEGKIGTLYQIYVLFCR